MKPEEQRIAIATACGWKEVQPPFEFRWMNPQTKWTEPEVPDYLSDLNAMNDAEGMLKGEQARDYANRLFHITLANRENIEEDSWFIHVRATASHRAEAFLKTLNLWTD